MQISSVQEGDILSKILKPAEILDATSDIGVGKANTKPINQFILAILAGAFIAFAAQGSNMAVVNLLAKKETFGSSSTAF